MSIINKIISKYFAGRLRKIDLYRTEPAKIQENTLRNLIQTNCATLWGKEHRFAELKTVKDFQQAVPIQSYDSLRPFIDRMRGGERDILSAGRVCWYAKSSGTTSERSKFIPVSERFLQKSHYQGPRDTLALYLKQRPQTRLFTGKTLTLGGSHQIDEAGNGSRYGDLSAILLQNTPAWVGLMRTPSKATALLADFQQKIEAIYEQSIKKNVVAFAGVPSWNMVLMKYILERTGKQNILEIWPNMELFIHGGVAFTPYREAYKSIFPTEKMNYMETYNASEGFFGIMDDLRRDDMLLMLDYDTFYEFVPLTEIDKESPRALSIEEVELGVQYALVISTSAGLWRYMIGDTVVFTSLYPHRIKISGRTKFFINAFGEEVILDNAERALAVACQKTSAAIEEYTAAPVFMDEKSNGAHQWLIEFSREPASLEDFTHALDEALREINSDYDAKRTGDITLRQPIVEAVPSGTFFRWMQSRGKLGGQNKVPRLANDRKHIEDILKMLE